MKTFDVVKEDCKVVYSFPTTIDEIDADYLKEITNYVCVSAHHCLIAIVYREKVSTIVMTYKQKKKSINTSVVPIFIKAGETDSEFIKNLEIKDKLIIPTSMLQLANHVNVAKNELSMDRFVSEIDKDIEAGKRGISANFPACFVDFKIVGVSDIVGAYKKEEPHLRKYTEVIYDEGENVAKEQ